MSIAYSKSTRLHQMKLKHRETFQVDQLGFICLHGHLERQTCHGGRRLAESEVSAKNEARSPWQILLLKIHLWGGKNATRKLSLSFRLPNTPVRQSAQNNTVFIWACQVQNEPNSALCCHKPPEPHLMHGCSHFCCSTTSPAARQATRCEEAFNWGLCHDSVVSLLCKHSRKNKRLIETIKLVCFWIRIVYIYNIFTYSNWKKYKTNQNKQSILWLAKSWYLEAEQMKSATWPFHVLSNALCGYTRYTRAWDKWTHSFC